MKRMLPWLMTILMAILLIAVAAVFLFNQFLSSAPSNDTEAAKLSAEKVETKKINADKRVELTAEIMDIKTNLADTDYIVVMSFAFQLDTKRTKTDFEKIKDIQIKPIIIRTLSDLGPEDLKGSQGKDALCAKLINLINPVLPDGKLTNVEITNFIITSL